MKIFIVLFTLMSLEQAFAQNRNDPVLHMGNRSNAFAVSASGTIFTSFTFEIQGFNDVASGELAAPGLAAIVTPAVNPCNNSANMCIQECVEYGLGLYQCYCSDGYEDMSTVAIPPSPLPQKGFVCEDIDECLMSAPCGKGQASCNNTIGSYNCTCVSGYVVSGNLTSCIDFDECTNATLSDCDPNASCVNMDGTFRCECNSGYDGDGTNGNCTDIDECASGNVTCGGHGSCANTDGSYRCNCFLGYQEDNSTGSPTCIDSDECTLDPSSCLHPDAECQNTLGSFFCRCKKGFSGNGTHCTDIDECINPVLNDCHRNATCTNTHGNYTCECHSDFLGDGFICNEGEMSYCFRAQVLGRINLIRWTYSNIITQSQTRIALLTVWSYYERRNPNFFVSGYNVTVERTRRSILVVNICFRAISKTPEELDEIFTTQRPTNTINGQFFSLRDYDECADNFLNCDDEATCVNTKGSATCNCPDNRYDTAEGTDSSGMICMEPIEFSCDGSKSNISLLTPYWARKYINVRNVFVNQGCSGSSDGIWHRFICNGTVTANETHLIAAFRVADVIPPGGYAINRLDTTFRCIQPTQQNFTTNITADENVVDPGVQTVDNAESSLKPLVFQGGYETAVVDGVKTGEKACVKLEDPNIPEDIKIMIEELHTSAPGEDVKFTLLRDYCPVVLPGLEIETTNGGICFTMHRPQASTILEVQLVVNLCTIDDCPTPSCERKRRSTLTRQKRSEELKAISFLIKIDPEDTCDRNCGTGACLLDYLNQKQCICPDQSIKTDDGKCKATRNGAFSDGSGSTSDINILILIVGLLAGAFLICLLGLVVYYSRRRSAGAANGKQMELKGVYTNNIDAD